MKGRLWGILILLLVAGGAVLYSMFSSSQPDPVAITGYLGGEKSGLYSSPVFQEYIDEEYGLSMDYRVVGSFNMVQGDTSGQNYLFPSSQLALELYEQLHGSPVEDDIVFNTPIVLYSRQIVVDALKNEGLVTEADGVNYIDMQKLANLIVQQTSWADLGLPQLYGNILVDTTDPNESNSGNMFLGVLANALNGNQTVNMSNVSNVEDDIRQIYQAIGYMQTSSSDMFSQFLRQGVGAYPLIAGYESQLLEFSKLQTDTYNQVKDDIVILYPEPTVWSSHVFIALDEAAEVGLDALLDPNVQKMAWENHGFRTIVSGTEDASLFDVPGLAKEVTKIISMPDIDTMLHLMNIIK